jgi:WD40 repeat protein
MWRETDATVFLITHALDEATMLADRIGVMSARPGRIVDVVETRWPRERDSRIMEHTLFGAITARLWKTNDGTPVGLPFEHDHPVKGAKWSYDGSNILTWVLNGDSVRVWKVADSMPVGPPLKHDQSVLGAIWSHDGSRRLTWSVDGNARVWKASDGTRVGSPLKHESLVEGAVWNHDDSLILTWSFDHTARLWDGATGKLAAPLFHLRFALSVDERDQS